MTRAIEFDGVGGPFKTQPVLRLKRLFAASHCICVPSKNEPFGTAVLNAARNLLSFFPSVPPITHKPVYTVLPI